MTKCPRCSSNAKLTGKEWEYARFHVKQYACPVCEKKFMEYYNGGALSHTIPKVASTPSEKILNLLKRNKWISSEEIAEKLHLNIDDISYALEKLEKDGLIQRNAHESGKSVQLSEAV